MRSHHGNAPHRGSQVNTHRRVRVTVTVRRQETAACRRRACAGAAGRIERRMETKKKGALSLYHLHSLKSKLGRQDFPLFFFLFLDIPDLSYRKEGRRDEEGGVKEKKRKKKQSNASSFGGNRKRLKERDSGRPFHWNNKNLTLTGNGSASKEKPDSFG